MTIRIVVVDDHPIVAEALAARLRLEREVDEVVTVTDGARALGAIERVRPHVVVWDLSIGEYDGQQLIAQARELFPRTEAVVATAHDDPHTAAEAVRAGATAVVSKNAPPTELVSAVLGAFRGESHFDPVLLHELLPLLARPPTRSESDERVAKLSQREVEVLRHMMAGEDRATLARALFVSVNTVRTHTRNILTKLEVHSSLEAVRVGLEAGLRPVEPTSIDLRTTQHHTR